MTILSKAQILAANDLTTETVDVPEWGGAVMVRALTGAARDAYEASMMTRDTSGAYVVDTHNIRAKLLVQTLVDETGALLFTEDELGALAGKSAAALERVFVVAQHINGLGNGAVEAAAKNSVSGQAADSASGSPPPSA